MLYNTWCQFHDICWSSQPRLTQSHRTVKDPIYKSRADDLIGYKGWAGLLTSWHLKSILQNPSVSLSIPGHHTFDHNLCFILRIPGCPLCACVRTHGLNLLGITILVPWGFSLPITCSSLATDYVLLELTIPPGSALYMLMQLTEFFCLLLTLLQSRVLSLCRVAVTATNLTNSSDAFCTA